MKLPRTSSAADATPSLQTVSDPAADELLLPPEAEVPDVPSEPQPADEPYPLQPDDMPDPTRALPRDATVEQLAWEELLAFIHAHKDPGTTVDAVDTETFLKGFA